MVRSKILGVVSAILFTGLLMAYTQQSTPGARRTVLEKQDLSMPGHEGVLVRTELAPGAVEPLHTHPGDFFAYVLEGTVTLNQQGRPSVQRKAGEVFFVPAGRVHGAANEGTTPVKLLVTFFVEKGKPLTTPAK